LGNILFFSKEQTFSPLSVQAFRKYLIFYPDQQKIKSSASGALILMKYPDFVPDHAILLRDGGVNGSCSNHLDNFSLRLYRASEANPAKT
jgi:hypothetical protein